ncbi:hypothetical protein [Terriglobus sp.]|uniref:hypothetical protein n=1 Tax=Terriglobus sp. TaxID=1889013 RepID=UPI003AFF7AC2
MRQTYQHGYLRRSKRKTGADRWEFLWRECDENGFIRRRTAILGSIEEYPDEVAAQGAANVIRMRLNADLLRHSYKPILISDLLDHYIATNLLADAGWHSASSRMNYDYFFRKWIRPQWGTMTIRSVRTLAVEHWLRNLRNAKGDPMANSTKAKIRSLMSLLFSTTRSAANGWSRGGTQFYWSGRVLSAGAHPRFSKCKKSNPCSRNWIASSA